MPCYRINASQQAAAAIKTSAAGATKPLYDEPWQDDDASTLTQLVLFTSNGIDEPVLGY